jgi:hypothetical protein
MRRGKTSFSAMRFSGEQNCVPANRYLHHYMLWKNDGPIIALSIIVDVPSTFFHLSPPIFSMDTSSCWLKRLQIIDFAFCWLRWLSKEASM